MSDSNYCKDCHSRDCQCFPDYESPVNELDRLRRENPELRARVAELEAEIAQLKARFSNEWEDGWPEWSGWCWFQYTKEPLGYTDQLPPTLAYIQFDKVELFLDHGTIKYKKLKKEFDGWQVRVIRIKQIRTNGKDWY